MRHPDEPVDILLTWPSDGLRLFQSMLPLGLLSIGTVLRKAGYTVALIDFNHYGGDFRKTLEALRPKVIGIGGTTPSRSGSFLTARIAKKVLPDVPVVYGGVHASFTSKETLEGVPQIDYIIGGEGEWSFLALCDRLTGKRDVSFDAIPGLCRRDRANVVINTPKRIDDLSALPFPDRDLLDDHYALEMEFIGGTGDFIMTSRGCTAACSFCAASRMFPGGVRTRPVAQVMEEIDYVRSRKNLAGIKLFDSTFTALRGHVIAFCDAIRSDPLPWECEIRADTVDRELLKMMKAAGCYYVNIGMETAQPELLRQMAKGITPHQVLGVLDSCRELGIRSKVFFTFGHPEQTFGQCLDDVRFIEQQRNRIDFFAVTVGMRIYPGTRLENRCRNNNLIGRKFSWNRRLTSIRNLLLFEPGDVPILFQRQLGPVRLSLILLLLLAKRLICTERFLLRMAKENLRGTGRAAVMHLRFTRHRFLRLRDRFVADRGR